MGRMILFGDWKRSATVLSKWAAASPKAIDAATRDEAHLFVRHAVKAFRTQNDGRWPGLNPITLALRKGASAVGAPSAGGSKALVRSGALRKAITVHRRGHANYFGGVHRSAGRSRGIRGSQSMVNVASIHETGLVVIPITDKMRAFFMWLFWKGAIPFPWPHPKKKFIVLPRRSYLRSAMRKVAPGHEHRFSARYANYLAGGGPMKLDA